MSVNHLVLDSDTLFSAAKPVGAPVSEVVALTRTALHQPLGNLGAKTGFWECTPGKFHRQVAEAEYSYIVKGQGTFTPEGSEPIPFSAGSVLFFESNSQGVWTIEKTVLKSYVIFA